MRKFILSLLATIAFFSTFAQEGSGLGFNWGMNVSNLVFSGDNTTGIDNGAKCGFSTELYYDVALWKNLYIQPGVAFSMRGMKCSSDDTKYSLGYLQIPTLLSYRIFIGEKHAFGFNVGPSFGYALLVKLKSTTTNIRYLVTTSKIWAYIATALRWD